MYRSRPWGQIEAPPQPSTLHLLRCRPWTQIEAPQHPSTLHLLRCRPCEQTLTVTMRLLLAAVLVLAVSAIETAGDVFGFTVS
jgi:hypothetical protein